jgi:hypothetical protein
VNPIKRFLSWLLPSHPPDPLARLLLAWRLWLVAALLGASLAWLFYALFPPPYRAQATVVVDHNLEDAWQYFPDRQLFFYLERETRKLEELAWSDAVLNNVVAEGQGVPVEELRAGLLRLSHSRDGAWHFLAEHQDSAIAQSLASAWARAFAAKVEASSIAVSPDLEAARAALNAEAGSDEPDAGRLTELMGEMTEAYGAASGISPFVVVAPTQIEHLPVEPAYPLSTVLFLGSALGVTGAALLALFFLRDDETGTVLA